MEEAKKFFRYITPGIVFLLVIIILLFISQPFIMLKIFIKALGDSNNPTLLFVALIASGGIGFIFSLIHHFLFWRIYSWLEWTSLIYDHRNILKNLEGQKYLEFVNQKNEPVKAKKISLENAWKVVCSIWYANIETSTPIKGSEKRTSSLSDIMHGTGTSFVGSCFAVIVWGCIQLMCFEITPCLWAGPIAILLIVVHLKNYQTTVSLCKGVIENILANELDKISKRGSWPYRVMMSE